jgi:hypothetical protein
MTFHTNLQKDTDMQRYNLRVMLFLSGLFISTGLFTMVILNLIVSGDSTTEKQNSIMLQSIHQNQVM